MDKKIKMTTIKLLIDRLKICEKTHGIDVCFVVGNLKEAAGKVTLRNPEDSDPRYCHESMLRSYQILQKVKELLKLGTPHEVILEMIEEMSDNDHHRRIPLSTESAGDRVS